MLLFTSTAFTQDYAYVSNPVVDVAIFHGWEALGPDNAITVPDGYFLAFAREEGYRYAFQEGGLEELEVSTSSVALPSGYKFYTIDAEGSFVIVYLHEYASSGSTFSYTEAELKNSVKLFPNPTISEVALNSEKTYEIEVFDILGNKVMELVGNSINMEHLSSATYIVNALDVETQESLSYKVINK